METIKNFTPGTTIIKEGTRGTSAYIIISGAVEVTKESRNQEITVATLGEGQVFGEMGLIEDKPRSAAVKAVTELKIREIDRDHFNELLKSKPSILIPLLKSLFERLRHASDMLAQLSIPEDKMRDAGKFFKVTVEGLTEQAKNALNNHELVINRFPFLIGRASEDSETDVFVNNDLSIIETKPYVISRGHLALYNDQGEIWAVDRGSAFGTIVNGNEIGTKAGTMRTLLDKEENQIIVGPATSKFIFILRPKPVD